MKYKIVIFPSQAIQDEANALRKRYDPRYSLIDPHITLKYHFHMADNQKETMIKKLSEIAQTLEPFPIDITKVKTFAPITNAIYFKVEPNESLTKLNDALHEEDLDDAREHAFIPHITVAFGLDADEYSDVYSTLKLNNISMQDNVDAFHLLGKKDSDVWEVIQSFKLGKE